MSFCKMSLTKCKIQHKGCYSRIHDKVLRFTLCHCHSIECQRYSIEWQVLHSVTNIYIFEWTDWPDALKKHMSRQTHYWRVDRICVKEKLLSSLLKKVVLWHAIVIYECYSFVKDIHRNHKKILKIIIERRSCKYYTP